MVVAEAGAEAEVAVGAAGELETRACEQVSSIRIHYERRWAGDAWNLLAYSRDTHRDRHSRSSTAYVGAVFLKRVMVPGTEQA
jgi:hypothetical protein